MPNQSQKDVKKTKGKVFKKRFSDKLSAKAILDKLQPENKKIKKKLLLLDIDSILNAKKLKSVQFQLLCEACFKTISACKFCAAASTHK